MPNLPPCTCKHSALCPINHHQLTAAMVAESLAHAKPLAEPMIAACEHPIAKIPIVMIQVVHCEFCPPLRWRFLWVFSYVTDASGDKVVTVDLHHAGILANQTG